MKRFISISLFAFLFVLGSCTKYDEGSNFSVFPAKARLVNHWTLTKYEIDEVDQDLNNASLEMDFFKDNSFKRTWIIGFQIPEEGKWSFVEGKNKLLLTKNNGDTELYTIVQLKAKDFKVKRLDNGKMNIWTFRGK